MINLDDKYNNTYHRKIKMKPIGVNSSKYIDFDVENNETDLKFKVGNHVTISKTFFLKVTLQIGQKKFLLKKLKILYQEHMLLVVLTVGNCWNLL